VATTISAAEPYLVIEGRKALTSAEYATETMVLQVDLRTGPRVASRRRRTDDDGSTHLNLRR
jgi:hypothetical protein